MTRDAVEEAGLESFPASDPPAWGRAAESPERRKTVLISGAATGLGQATAKRFKAAGWNVVAGLRRPGFTAPIVAASGALLVRLDVSDGDSIERAFRAGIGRFGSVDVVVNNADSGTVRPRETTSAEHIAEDFSAKVLGVMKVAKAAVPCLGAHGGGRIVNVGLSMGVSARSVASVLHAVELALERFFASQQDELSSHAITVRFVRTDDLMGAQVGGRHPRRRAGPEALAKLVFQVATDDAPSPLSSRGLAARQAPQRSHRSL